VQRLLFLILPLVAATFGAQEAVSQNGGRKALANTWSATSSTGVTLMGTWTATADSKTGHVTGTWTLLDAQRRTVARGGWSATKASAEWTGDWRATVSGSGTEYSGTWSASVGLQAQAPLADLFGTAVQRVMSGRWRAGSQSGTWSIRAFN
jgi:hypothetical protein